MTETQTKDTPEQIEEHCGLLGRFTVASPDDSPMSKSLQIIRQLQQEVGVIAALRKTVAEQRTAIRQLQEEGKRLKDALIREADTMAAYAPFDDLCNDARFVKRLFLSIGDIVPELKDLAGEVEPLLNGAAKAQIPHR